MTVRILTVCTGNICRSPYVHLLLGDRLEAVRPGAFDVSSAGVYALVGQGVDAGSVAHLGRHGVAHGDFAARQLSEPILQPVDLVLAMSTEHRKQVLSYTPRLVRRTFTLKEMARLIDAAKAAQPWADRLAGLGTPEERWAEISRQLAVQRQRSRVEAEIDDLADPYRQPQEAFDLMAREADAAVDRIVALEASF